jgi:hypothetical protein
MGPWYDYAILFNRDYVPPHAWHGPDPVVGALSAVARWVAGRYARWLHVPQALSWPKGTPSRATDACGRMCYR